MKKLLIFTVFFLLSKLVVSQALPLIEDFNQGSTWLFTNGAGIQNYGGPENYVSFNIGSSPYLNSSEIIIESPIYDFTNYCNSYLVLSFPISGYIEPTDTLTFQYFNYDWITITRFSGYYDNPMAVFNAPFEASKFRFVLKTDSSKIKYYTQNLTDPVLIEDSQHPIIVDESNTYVGGRPLAIQVYYYDITSFKIECGVSLPITLKSFTGEKDGEFNLVKWVTGSETNNDFFSLEKSSDGLNFIEFGILNGAGNSTTDKCYSLLDMNPYPITYYRLKQTDFNGDSVTSNTISITRSIVVNDITLIKRLNILGQEVPDNYDGIKFYLYSDGSVVKKYTIREK